MMSGEVKGGEVTTSIDALAVVLSNDYSHFLNVDRSKECEKLQEAVDANLAILEEFCQVFETLRSESSYCYEQVIPLVQSKLPLLDQLCLKVDKLERSLEIMKTSVDAMEDAVTKAEATLDTGVSMKKLLGSWFTSGRSRRSSSQRVERFVPPAIFKTEQLFPQNKSDEAEGACGGS